MTRNDDDHDSNGNETINEDELNRLTFGMAGYCFKLNILQQIEHEAPRVVPPLPESDRQRRSRRNTKLHCVLWCSGGYTIDPGQDESLLIPFVDDEPVLSSVRKLLFSMGAFGGCVQMLALRKKLKENVRVFDLPSLGLQMICCPEPRDDSMLKSNERITVSLAKDDNRLAGLLLLAERGFDMTKIQDIFGPVLIMFGKPHRRHLRMKHFNKFMKSYFGIDIDDLGTFLQCMMKYDREPQLPSKFQPNLASRKAYKKISRMKRHRQICLRMLP